MNQCGSAQLLQDLERGWPAAVPGIERRDVNDQTELQLEASLAESLADAVIRKYAQNRPSLTIDMTAA